MFFSSKVFDPVGGLDWVAPAAKTALNRKHLNTASRCDSKSFDIHAAIEPSEASIDVHLSRCLKMQPLKT